MMNTIIKESSITFKELEKNIFQKICQIGRDITKEVLESHDRSLMDSRDTKIYRNKGLRQTTIKTIYGASCIIQI